MSETSAHKHHILEYLNSDNIIDIGFGGSKVVPHAKGCDLPRPYTKVGEETNDIPADITKGLPISDNSFDIVFSSHLIEDFPDTARILNEMIRILTNNGRLILFFPDEQRYRKLERPQFWNKAHKHLDMGFKFMQNKLKEVEERFGHTIKYVYTRDEPSDGYNVIIVCEVLKSSL
jgi:SAM-dependent methyltransferase